MRGLLGFGLGVTLLWSMPVGPATAGLIDCKVILCLAGGFPGGCEDAHSYMMDRIMARPPKPPFGTCHTVSVQGDQEIYKDASATLGLTEGPSRCVAWAPQLRDDDGGWCTRQCFEISRTVDLSVRIEGEAAPYRASYAFARSERCEALGRDGRSADDAK